MLLSLDTETYGAVSSLPEQRHFHPYRSLIQDGISLKDLILCASISTVAVPVPSTEGCLNSPTTGSWNSVPSGENGHLLMGSPASTQVFNLNTTQHSEWLKRWLKSASTLLLMNAQYDLLYLRSLPEFRYVLDGSHVIVDLAVLSYLENEMRPEKSLKNMGPVLRTHIYERTAADKFSGPNDPALLQYCAEDTHNTVLAASELCKRIARRYSCSQQSVDSASSSSALSVAGSPASTGRPASNNGKLSGFCLQFYSDTIWSCVRMSEAGIPFSLTKLRLLEAKHKEICASAFDTCLIKFSLRLEGEGSHLSKKAFIDNLIEQIEVTHPDKKVRSHPLLVLTDTTKQISFNEENRRLFQSLLPTDHPLHEPLNLWGEHAFSQKLLSSYLHPLLHHRRNHPEDESAKIIPCSSMRPLSHLGVLPDSYWPSSSKASSKPSGGELGLAFGTWYVVPTQAKDTSGDSGGTLQGRITIKKPAAQTFPPLIKDCESSRFGLDGCLVGMDLEQAELKVAALLSRDAGMVAEYQKAKPDLHGGRAISIYGPDVVKEIGWRSGDKRTDKRQWGKTLNFADLFLAAAPRMQKTILELSGILVPMEFFIEIENSRYQDRPGLTEWQLSLAEIAERQGYLELPYTGQSRHFTGFTLDRMLWNAKRVVRGRKGIAKDLISEVVNFPVQTTAGNTLLRIQAYIHKHMPSMNHPSPPCYMCLNGYDALLFDCHNHYVSTLKQIVDDAVKYVRHKEYWSWLQELSGVEVPLTYELKVK